MAKYLVTVDGHEYDIEVDYRQSGYKLTVNGAPVEVVSNDLGGTRSQLLVDNRSFEVDVRADGRVGERTVFMLGIEIPAIIEDYNLARMRKTAGMSAGPTVDRQFRAPMPGMVLEVKVSAGDQVKKGAPMMIIEAMKMENVIKAPANATIAKVVVDKGRSVEKNDVLIEFDL
ncbi:MAG: biotin/lipoyl-containing protein [bacterium]